MDRRKPQVQLRLPKQRPMRVQMSPRSLITDEKDEDEDESLQYNESLTPLIL